MAQAKEPSAERPRYHHLHHVRFEGVSPFENPLVVLEERRVSRFGLSYQNGLAEVIHGLLLGYLLDRQRGRQVVLRWGDRGVGRAGLGAFGVPYVGGVELVVLLPKRSGSLESGGFVVAPWFVARPYARPRS